MQQLDFYVKKQTLVFTGDCRPVIERSRQNVFVNFTFDEEWDGTAVTVLFDNDHLNETKATLWQGVPLEVPQETLISGYLRIGCIGLRDEGKVRLTTKRMKRGLLVFDCAGLTGIAPEDVTPALWEQALAEIGDLSKLNTLDKTNLVAAINEALQSGGGSFPFKLGDNLQVIDGTLSVKTADVMEADNSLPITSSAVYVEVGNINALLATI